MKYNKQMHVATRKYVHVASNMLIELSYSSNHHFNKFKKCFILILKLNLVLTRAICACTVNFE